MPKSMQRGNTYGQTTPVSEIIIRPSFLLGLNDIRKGRPWASEYDWQTMGWQQSYERGRAFAICLNGYRDGSRLLIVRAGKATKKAWILCSEFVRRNWVI